MKRRDFILAGAAVALPAKPALPSGGADSACRFQIIQLIEQLEAAQGWESCSVVATKSFVAWQLRKALSLPQLDDSKAQLHIEFQRGDFERYQRSIWAEQERARGITYELPSLERELT